MYKIRIPFQVTNLYSYFFLPIFIYMKEINKDSLFNIFEANDEAVYKEYGLEEALDSPCVKLGMVLEGLQNYQLLDLIQMKRSPKEYQRVKDGIQAKYFVRLYKYLERIDINDLDDIRNLHECFHTEDILDGLNTLKVYFEKIEHYEKCGTIQKYQNTLIQVTVKD